MAKQTKWDNLTEFVRTALDELLAVPNPTAEQVGETAAFVRVLGAMTKCEQLEKKLDKS